MSPEEFKCDNFKRESRLPPVSGAVKTCGVCRRKYVCDSSKHRDPNNNDRTQYSGRTMNTARIAAEDHNPIPSIVISIDQ